MTHPSLSNLKFAVLQIGARMHYGVPALLQRAGMLQHFYTDLVGNIGLMKLADSVIPEPWRPDFLRRLFGRRLPSEISPGDVTSVPVRSLLHHVARSIPRGFELPVMSPHEALRRMVLANNFHGANALYALDNSDLALIGEGKRRGLFIVYEQIICGEVGRLIREERARYPGVEPQSSHERVEDGIIRDLEVWATADITLVASDFVRDGMIALGCRPEKIAVVPYGLPEHWFAQEAHPEPGRVLFVGTVGLRKGNHYLAEATRLLRDRGVDVDVRVVGPYDPMKIAHPLFLGPHYVGQVPREQVRREFSEADVFVLPTIAESFGLVHLEAMAYGVPVITTRNCGSVVRDGEEGFIVPIRDATSLADRIQCIVQDRALRSRLSLAARRRAAEFTWTHYRDRMLNAIRDAAGKRSTAGATA